MQKNNNTKGKVEKWGEWEPLHWGGKTMDQDPIVLGAIQI